MNDRDGGRPRVRVTGVRVEWAGGESIEVNSYGQGDLMVQIKKGKRDVWYADNFPKEFVTALRSMFQPAGGQTLKDETRKPGTTRTLVGV